MRDKAAAAVAVALEQDSAISHFARWVHWPPSLRTCPGVVVSWMAGWLVSHCTTIFIGSRYTHGNGTPRNIIIIVAKASPEFPPNLPGQFQGPYLFAKRMKVLPKNIYCHCYTLATLRTSN